MGWQDEIIRLQDFLEAYYLGQETSLSPVEQALHPAFTYAGPNGETADREATLEMIRQGHGHTVRLRIVTSNHELLHETPEVIVAGYVERHELSRGDNERLCTVIFVVDRQAPNGVRWLRTHESWIRRFSDGS